jgi:predicted dehydrogenase
MNWIMGTHPVKVMGMGGRQQRTHPDYGHIFDHFALELEYPDGRKVTSMSRQIPGCQNRVGEYVMGTKGFANPGQWTKGAENYRFSERGAKSPYVQEHTDLIASIRSGEPLNESLNVAQATMVAIMGRMSAYTGKLIEWDWAMNESKLDLMPEDLAFGPRPVDPVAIPGQTELL